MLCGGTFGFWFWVVCAAATLIPAIKSAAEAASTIFFMTGLPWLVNGKPPLPTRPAGTLFLRTRSETARAKGASGGTRRCLAPYTSSKRDRRELQHGEDCDNGFPARAGRV